MKMVLMLVGYQHNIKIRLRALRLKGKAPWVGEYFHPFNLKHQRTVSEFRDFHTASIATAILFFN
jgi:hypothetical protein